MNNTSTSSGSTATGSSTPNKIFVTDPFPIVRYLNMGLAAGMLIFALINILDVFTAALNFSDSLIVAFFINIYQM